MSTLFVNGRIRTVSDDSDPDWALVEDGTIAGVGSFDDAPTADRIEDLDGGTLVPAFCDAHCHLPATGLQATGLDFRGERSVTSILDAFASKAADPGSVLYGGNFEDPLDRALTRTEMDSAVGDRAALLTRADMHSCVVSSALLERLSLDGVGGVDRDAGGRPTGYLREHGAAEAWRWFDANLPAAAQKTAIRAAVDLAYSKGIGAVHEMFVVEWRGWSSLEILLDAVSEVALVVSPFIATLEVDRVKTMGFPRIGGDLFLDGSFGSHTAWMKEPYTSPPPAGSGPTGIAYRDDDELFDYFLEAQTAGLLTAVHAIGDAAIEQAIVTWEKVAGKAGLESVRALGHRIEHFECGTDDHIARAARLNLGLSVQPAFDRFWGGPGGLYSRRIGWERASKMNRFRSMLDGGLVVGAGSDSTVTPLDPFLQMAALREHNVPDERIGPRVALMLHTYGGHALMRGASATTRGAIGPGRRADLTLLDRDPITSSSEEMLATQVLGTWIGGQRVWPPAEAVAP